MKNVRKALVLVATLCLTFFIFHFSFLIAQEPPLVGRPENFSGLVGFWRTWSRVNPTEVRVEEPLTLTVFIESLEPSKTVPERSKLRLFPPEMEEDFYIEPLPEKDVALPTASTWQFVWRLRPKDDKVTEVPALRLVYYMPARRKYQTAYGEAVPITVKPPADAARIPNFADIPSSFFEIVPAEELLHVPWYEEIPLPLRWGLGALGPPLGCAVWYWLWRRKRKGALLRRPRLSKEATLALAALPFAPAEGQAAIMADYLRKRWQLAGAEPTPAEVERHLKRMGVRKEFGQQMAAWLKASDSQRFASTPRKGTEGAAAEASGLVQLLEAESCPTRR